jgi:hypothetical protein
MPASSGAVTAQAAARWHASSLLCHADFIHILPLSQVMSLCLFKELTACKEADCSFDFLSSVYGLK